MIFVESPVTKAVSLILDHPEVHAPARSGLLPCPCLFSTMRMPCLIVYPTYSCTPAAAAGMTTVCRVRANPQGRTYRLDYRTWNVPAARMDVAARGLPAQGSWLSATRERHAGCAWHRKLSTAHNSTDATSNSASATTAPTVAPSADVVLPAAVALPAATGALAVAWLETSSLERCGVHTATTLLTPSAAYQLSSTIAPPGGNTHAMAAEAAPV